MKSLSHVQLSVTLWTAAYQAPLSMGFSRQEYWSGVPLPSSKCETPDWSDLRAWILNLTRMTLWALQFLENTAHWTNLREWDRDLGQSLLVAEKPLRKSQIVPAAPNGISLVLTLCGAFSYQDNHLQQNSNEAHSKLISRAADTLKLCKQLP